jgi:hypothetical protein
MPCAADPNGTEICLPFRSRRLCAGASLGTTRPLPAPAALPDRSVM